jgi:hypothetical protein
VSTSAVLDGNTDAHALLGHIAKTEGVTPETVAALLLRCDNERLRNAILKELASKWGNAAVQRTLAVEKEQRAGQKDLAPSNGHPGAAASHDATPRATDRHRSKAKPPTDADWNTARTTLQIAADILQHQRRQMLAEAPAQYASSLWMLHAAVAGRTPDGSLQSAERIHALHEAKAGLEPAIALFQCPMTAAHGSRINCSRRWQRFRTRCDSTKPGRV